MSFIYYHLNFHANLLRPWRFHLKSTALFDKINIIQMANFGINQKIIYIPYVNEFKLHWKCNGQYMSKIGSLIKLIDTVNERKE
jgi:hypothetical protein